MRKHSSNTDSYFGADGNQSGGWHVRSWFWHLLRRPSDVVCLTLASAATVAVVINALLLQAGPHPAPIFSSTRNPGGEATSSAATSSARPRQLEVSRTAAERPTAPAGKTGQAAKPSTVPASAVIARSDPIAEVLEPANRVVAVQRALAEFGYGQIKPTGIAGADTKAAIEKFERERKLPVTGQISERVSRELAAMKGGPL